MKVLKPGDVLKCPRCGRVLVHPNRQGEVAGKFICPRNDCELGKKKQPIEV